MARTGSLIAACAIFVVCGCSSESSTRKPTSPTDTAGTISTTGCSPGETATKYPGVSNRTLNIAVTPVTPPFIFTDAKDRRIVGFDADFVEAWSRCLGVKYKWQVYQETSALIAAVQSGRADLVHGELYVTPTRAKQVDFVVYMKTFTGSAVRKGNPKKVESLDDLCGKTAAQAVGVAEIRLVEDQADMCKRAGKPVLRLVVYRDNNLAIRALVTGRADVFLGGAFYVKSIAEQFPDEVETSFTIDNNVTIGVGISKQQAELRQAILEAIKAIQKNGTEDRLLRKWGLDVKQAVPAHPVP